MLCTRSGPHLADLLRQRQAQIQFGSAACRPLWPTQSLASVVRRPRRGYGLVCQRAPQPSPAACSTISAELFSQIRLRLDLESMPEVRESQSLIEQTLHEELCRNPVLAVSVARNTRIVPGIIRLQAQYAQSRLIIFGQGCNAILVAVSRHRYLFVVLEPLKSQPCELTRTDGAGESCVRVFGVVKFVDEIHNLGRLANCDVN